MKNQITSLNFKWIDVVSLSPMTLRHWKSVGSEEIENGFEKIGSDLYFCVTTFPYSILLEKYPFFKNCSAYKTFLEFSYKVLIRTRFQNRLLSQTIGFNFHEFRFVGHKYTHLIDFRPDGTIFTTALFINNGLRVSLENYLLGFSRVFEFKLFPLSSHGITN